VNIQQEISTLLQSIGPGKMSSTAYDTAWVARLGDIDAELSNHALEWLCENQLPDGSWGAAQPFYYHDRVISTLAAMIALTRRGRRIQDKNQIEKGLLALEKITSGVDKGGLAAHPNGATVGFEMIVPTLVAEAEKLGLIKQQGERVLGHLSQQRSAKLSLIQGKMINRNVTVAFSAEMAGIDGQHMLDVDNLQEGNGSVGHSPSATAYFALYVKPGDPNALRYLQQAAAPDGGAPNLAPFDIYERAWVAWNLSLPHKVDNTVLPHLKPHLNYLKDAWQPGMGVGFSQGYSIPDGDDTIITYDVLKRYGYEVDLESVLSFEDKEFFRCYDLEVGISPSMNIHALLTLRRAGYERNHPTIQKILHFLSNLHDAQDCWRDKWHLSPCYTTAHMAIACTDYLDGLAEKSIDWILSMQNDDGSWGFFMPTAEETAYCLQALCIWNQHTGKVPKHVLEQGASWLYKHSGPPYYPLWIGKGLYSADFVVRSAILSALQLVETNT